MKMRLWQESRREKGFLPPRLRRKGMSGRLVVLRARITRPNPGWTSAAPGTVLAVDKAGPIVKCHDTALPLIEVKPEGGSAMDGGAFLRGRPLVPFTDSLLPE